MRDLNFYSEKYKDDFDKMFKVSVAEIVMHNMLNSIIPYKGECTTTKNLFGLEPMNVIDYSADKEHPLAEGVEKSLKNMNMEFTKDDYKILNFYLYRAGHILNNKKLQGKPLGVIEEFVCNYFNNRANEFLLSCIARETIDISHINMTKLNEKIEASNNSSNKASKKYFEFSIVISTLLTIVSIVISIITSILN